MVGFRLANTLSEHGGVSRGVARVNAAGEMLSVEEVHGIVAAEVGPGRRYSGDEPVSLNCWGFTPALFAGLDRRFPEFLRAKAEDLKAEFYLPAAVSAMVAAGEAVVDVRPTSGSWFGVTYREDKPRVQEAIGALVRAGHYPERLWG
jgi:hypothetical protein